MGSYYIAAIVLVLAIPVGLLTLGFGLVAWGRDAVRRSPVVGGLGVACTVLAIGNLVVARSCAAGVNRPIVSAALSSDACHRSGVIAVEIALLLVVATAAVVRLGEIRR